MVNIVDIRPFVAADLATIIDLLRACGLPTDDVQGHAAIDFLIGEAGGETVGTCGLERAGPHGLLRSLAVEPGWRGRAIGRALVDACLAHARASGQSGLWLLTTDAERYFERFGFRRLPRSEAPAAIRNTQQFRALCPASAIVMRLDLA